MPPTRPQDQQEQPPSCVASSAARLGLGRVGVLAAARRAAARMLVVALARHSPLPSDRVVFFSPYVFRSILNLLTHVTHVPPPPPPMFGGETMSLVAQRPLESLLWVVDSASSRPWRR